MIDLIILQCIVVFIIDICQAWKLPSGIISYILMHKWDTTQLIKPFCCSLCMTFWVGLIYIICTGFSIPLLGFVCLLAFLTPVTNSILYFISDNLIKILNTRLK